MTSYTESFGIVLIEAMSHGIPCLAFTSAEGANDLITNNENDKPINSFLNKLDAFDLNEYIKSLHFCQIILQKHFILSPQSLFSPQLHSPPDFLPLLPTKKSPFRTVTFQTEISLFYLVSLTVS